MARVFISLRIYFVLSVILGIGYPVLIWSVGQLAFKSKADGELLLRNGKPVAEQLIGQNFTQTNYFWGRPSANGYDAQNSGGSNLGPTAKKLVLLIQQRLPTFESTNGISPPNELLLASASGLDPHISPNAANYQAERVARERHLNLERVQKIIEEHTEQRQYGLFSEPVVHVVKLNLALDALGGSNP